MAVRGPGQHRRVEKTDRHPEQARQVCGHLPGGEGVAAGRCRAQGQKCPGHPVRSRRWPHKGPGRWLGPGATLEVSRCCGP